MFVNLTGDTFAQACEWVRERSPPRCGARAAEAAAAAASAGVAWLLLSLADDEREKEERTRELLMFLQTEILRA